MRTAATAPTRLPAKSARRGKPPETALSLRDHSLQTEQAAVVLFGEDVRWGDAWCRFFRVADRQQFLLNLRVACLFHDLGKANEDFVAAVQHTLKGSQSLRHEHLSALILCYGPVRSWLAQHPAIDVDVITAAVLSHHLKATPKRNHQHAWANGTPPLRLFLQHADVDEVLAKVAKVLRLEEAPSLPTERWDQCGVWEECWCTGAKQAKAFGREMRGECKPRSRRSLWLALKAGLIVADSAASGLVREGHDLAKWCADVADAKPLTKDNVFEHVVEPRCQQLRRGGPFGGFLDFQQGAAECGPRTLLMAGCGTGKTLAAWLWAANMAAKRPIGRVVFLYPTRGTANEGFRDYVSWAPEALGALRHGTADYELEEMRHNPSEAMTGKDFRDEANDRLFAMKLWPKRYFSATVDQFLSFIEHNYGSICSLPILADAAVVVDEVHSFDGAMFRGLLDVLRNFDVPVLCMTATLTRGRIQQLQDAGMELYPADDAARGQLHGLESRARYAIETLPDKVAAMVKACAAFAEGQRVLWVVNTVNRCQALARQLEATLGQAPLCYHSRFTLKHRQGRHTAVVAAFQSNELPAIAVTTQVCEMSLDLDADVLISEYAPISSLVQRFGRANRHGNRWRANVYAYPAAGGNAPYSSDDIKDAKKFLAKVAGDSVSQHDLAAALEKLSPVEERSLHDTSGFVSSGYYALPGSFRETDDRTQAAILSDDVTEVAARVAKRQPVDGYVLQVPKRSALPESAGTLGLPRYLAIAPSDHYQPHLGFCKEASA